MELQLYFLLIFAKFCNKLAYYTLEIELAREETCFETNVDGRQRKLMMHCWIPMDRTDASQVAFQQNEKMNGQRWEWFPGQRLMGVVYPGFRRGGAKGCTFLYWRNKKVRVFLSRKASNNICEINEKYKKIVKMFKEIVRVSEELLKWYRNLRENLLTNLENRGNLHVYGFRQGGEPNSASSSIKNLFEK